MLSISRVVKSIFQRSNNINIRNYNPKNENTVPLTSSMWCCFRFLKSNDKTSTFKQKFYTISYPVSPFKFLHIKLPVQTPHDTNHAWLGHENLFLQRALPHFMKEKSNSPTLSC